MILCFGEVASDLILAFDQLPQTGSAPLRGERDCPGGSALNTAMILHHWRIPTFLGGNLLGRDLGGNSIVHYLEEHHLKHHLLQITGAKTPRCVCLVNQMEKTRSFLLDGGTVHKYKAGQVEFLSPENYTFAFIDPYIGQAAEVVLEKLQTTDMWILTHDLPSTSPYLGQFDVVQVSVDPGEFDRNNLIKRASTYLVDRTKWVVFTGGERGALAVGKKTISVDPHPCEPLDTTGCGDAFRAGLLYGLERGASFEQALDIAAWAGAKVAEFLGAHGKLPSPEDHFDLDGD